MGQKTIGRKIESAINNMIRREWRNALDDICIAIDGTASKKFSTLGNRAKMKKFAKEYETYLFQYVTGGSLQTVHGAMLFGSSRREWAEIFYTCIRCNSLHGDDQFDDFVVIDIDEQNTIRLDEQNRIVINETYILALLYSVIMDPVNVDEVCLENNLTVESKGKKMKINWMWGNKGVVEEFTGFLKYPVGLNNI
jgi:hypothetical protein